MKKSILQKASLAGAMAAGAVLMLGSGTAQADPDIGTLGNHGIGNGNQVVAPIQAPIDICGNAVAVAGLSGAGCQGGAAASMDNDWDAESGKAESGKAESGKVTETSTQDDLGDMLSAGNNGIANGNQAQVPIQAPISACGNAVGALVGVAGAGCQGGSAASLGDDDMDEGSQVSEASTQDDLGDMLSAGNNGILNGNQLQTPVQVPINVCGNAIAVAGVAGAGCDGGSSASLGDDDWDNGDYQADQADQVDWSAQADQAAQDQAAQDQAAQDQAAQDQYAAPAANQQPTEAAPSDDGLLGDMTSAGNNGILNGTQVQAPVQAPIDVSGNAVGVLGVAGAGSTGGSAADMG